MTKNGRPSLGRAGVEDLGDIRMVHQRQGLAFRLEPGQDGPRVHPRLDQLERHHPLDRPGLLGEVDAAHPAFADLLADLVPPATMVPMSEAGEGSSAMKPAVELDGLSSDMPGGVGVVVMRGR